jgi:hypothetical protein
MLRYQSLSSENCDLQAVECEADEKILIAGVLLNFGNPDDSKQYERFISQWLAPPNGIHDTLLLGYNERRRIAVSTIEKFLAPSSTLIHQLQSILAEDGLHPAFVADVQRVLDAIKERRVVNSGR